MTTFSPKITVTDYLTFADWIVFFAILAICIAAALLARARRAKIKNESDSILDFILIGRRLTLPLFVATLVSSWYGGIFGVTRIAYEKGIYNFITQGFFWYLSYVVFALFMAKKIHDSRALTLPELIGMRFGPQSAKLGAIFNFFNVVPIAYAISLGLFTQFLFGGSFLVNMTVSVFFATAYTAFGGFRADIYTDVVQFFVMCISVVLVLGFSYFGFGGIGFLEARLPSTHFDPLGGESLANVLVWGFIAFATLIDPCFYQRCFAAKDSSVAVRGILISTVIWFCFDLCTTFGAMYARAVLPESDSSQAYLFYSIQLLPSGLRGFMLAGILAIIMSTLDSFVFIAGTTLTYDIFGKNKKLSINAHRLGILGVGGLAVVLGNYFEGNIKMVWKTVGSYFAATMLLPVLVGFIFPGKISDRQFCVSCIVGVIATTFWRYYPRTGFWGGVDEIYIGALSTGLTIGLLALSIRNHESR